MQTALQQVDMHTIDAAELAVNFFVRELETLNRSVHQQQQRI